PFTGLTVIDGKHLRFLFPDTDAQLLPTSDARTFTGPATIAVTRTSDPLPCQLASTSCVGQSGLIAWVASFFTDDGTCGTPPPVGAFAQFTGRPFPNDVHAVCWNPPACTALAPEVRLTVDSAGNVLIPMDWRGVLVRSGNVPFPRLMRATFAPPVPFTIPGS